MFLGHRLPERPGPVTARSLQPRWPDRLTTALQARRRGGRRARGLRRLAALLLFAAAGVMALSGPGPSGSPVVTVTADLPAGATITAADLSTTNVEHPPDGSFTRQSDVLGRMLSGPVRGGETLTDARVVAPNGPDPGPGRAAVPVRPDDPATVALLSAGMHVAVIAVDKDGRASTLAADAVVLAVPPAAAHIGGDSGRLVVLAVPTAVADSVAAATLTGALTLRFA